MMMITRRLVITRLRQSLTTSSSSPSYPSSSSSTTTTTTFLKNKTTTTTHRQYSVYAWGKSIDGTIPLTMEEKNNPSIRHKDIIDHPCRIDVEDAFGAGEKVKEFICGPTSSGVVLESGTYMTWGSNKNGELGQGHQNVTPKPTPITLLSPPTTTTTTPTTTTLPSQTLYLGSAFSAIIDTESDLHTFGFGGSALSGLGCLGHGDGISYHQPKCLTSLIEDGCHVKDVGCGELHMVVLTTEGEVLTCGSGSYGRLGNLGLEGLDTVSGGGSNEGGGGGGGDGDQLYLETVEVLEGEGRKVKQLGVGLAFSMALNEDGVIYSWGRNDKGQLGTGMGLAVDMYAMEALPQPIESQLEGRNVIKIAAGHSHAACVTEDGELFVWGSAVVMEPELQSSLLHTKCIDVACGRDYTIALDQNHQLYSFGKGKTGVLGHAGVTTLNQPTLVEALKDKKVVSMSAGWDHFSCLVED